MVNLGSVDEQTRTAPAYALERIRELARAGKVVYASRRVELDIGNLNFNLEEVCRCLASLDSTHFKHSKRYPGKQKWMDVYCLTWASKGGPDDLYIKLMLGKHAMIVSLCSFHGQR